jgi:hypothetical protein
MKGSTFSQNFAAALACVVAVAAPAFATDSTVNTFDEGYYYNYDEYVSTNASYLTGQITVGQGVDKTVVGYHSFFAFNALIGLDGPITSASLSIQEPAGGYSSTQPSETFNLTAFTGNVTTLTTDTSLISDGSNLGEYSALENGTLVGTAMIGPGNNGTSIHIQLNPDGISFLNSMIGHPFAFGGFLSGVSLANSDTRYLFGGSESLPVTSTVLSLTTASVPEPGVLSLMGIGLVLLLGGAAPRVARRIAGASLRSANSRRFAALGE